MGLIIEDGKGTGKSAGVTEDNKLEVEAVTSSKEHYTNHHDGTAFNITFNQSPTAADDCIAFVQNTADDDMVLEGVTIGVKNCTADDSIYFKLGDEGTRNSATDVTPVNINAGSGKSGLYKDR